LSDDHLAGYHRYPLCGQIIGDIDVSEEEAEQELTTATQKI
jgi:hypothetical protein